MNSPYAIAFQGIIDRLKQVAPAIKHIDQDFGQVEGEQRPPLKYPAVLVDFPNTNYDSLLEFEQTATALVTLKLITEPYVPGSSHITDEMREKALYYYELEALVVAAIHGWYPPESQFGYFMRTTAAGRNLRNGLRMRTLTFSLAWEEKPLEPVYTLEPKPVDVELYLNEYPEP